MAVSLAQVASAAAQARAAARRADGDGDGRISSSELARAGQALTEAQRAALEAASRRAGAEGAVTPAGVEGVLAAAEANIARADANRDGFISRAEARGLGAVSKRLLGLEGLDGFDAPRPAAARQRGPGRYGRLQPPRELQQYGNGRLPAGVLEPLGVGDHRLYAPAARAFRAMHEAAARDGVRLSLRDSYRPYSEQVALARRLGLYSRGGFAATPGKSNHGWGLAVDVDLDASRRALRWMRDNAARFGFHETVLREPWHWEYRPTGR